MPMIIEFTYKGTVIATRKLDFPFTQQGQEKARAFIQQKLIRFPENWDSYKMVRNNNDNL